MFDIHSSLKTAVSILIELILQTTYFPLNAKSLQEMVQDHTKYTRQEGTV